MEKTKSGIYTIDFSCDETGCELSVFAVTAFDSEHAERKAREALNPQYVWRCTGIDRARDARE
jgi:hypothetical protein